MGAANLPGFTAERSLSLRAGGKGRASMEWAAAADEDESIEPQSCTPGELAICTIWLQTCLGWCWWSKFGGSRACIGCMSTCLSAHFAPGFCSTCLTPGPGVKVC
jgi:hypothetical protein